MASSRGSLVGFTGGRGEWWASELLNFVMKGCENGIKNSISGKGVVIKVVVRGCLLVYVEAFYCAFLLELYYLHDVVHATKGM